MNISCSNEESKNRENKKGENYRIVFSHSSGHYPQEFDLVITCKDVESNIYYSLDGSVPNPQSKSSFKYKEPIRVAKMYLEEHDLTFIPTTILKEKPFYNMWLQPKKDMLKGMVVRAQIFKDGKAVKKEVAKTYFVDELDISLPEIYLTINEDGWYDNDTGIYVLGSHYNPQRKYSGNFFEKGIEWERASNLEYLDKDQKVLLDQKVGVRIHGRCSPESPSKSLRFYSRKKYGKSKMKFNPFGNGGLNSYKRLLLRTPYSTWNKRIFADQLIPEIFKDMDFEYAKSSPVNLYLNGEYWGILDLCEKMDRYFFNDYFDIDKDSLQYATAAYNSNYGESDNFKELYDFVDSNDLTTLDNYHFVSEQMDIDNYIDYVVMENYMANVDWPGNNNERWKGSKKCNKWRWLIVDMDAIMTKKNHMMLKKLMDIDEGSSRSRQESTLLFRKLIANEEFKNKFVRRSEEIMSTVLCPKRLVAIIEKYEALYEGDIKRQVDRWHLPETVELYYERNNKMKSFVKERAKYVIDEIEERFGIRINPVCK
ncbi:MAG: CotH kinase family protein [Flavobacteriales bacterium]|nr:CotH kinase family protein [Flavobacteriales bacterium]